MRINKLLSFCLSLIGLCPSACTVPVIDTEYKETLHSPSTFMFKGKLWIMGSFHKTVSKTYNPRLFYGATNWHKNVHAIPSDRVYSVSDENAILEKTLKAQNALFGYSVSIDEKLHFEGVNDNPGVYRDSRYYIEHDGKIFVIGGNRNKEHEFRPNSEKSDEDVWSSEDGLNWQLAIKNPPWAEKWNQYDGHRITGLNGYIYLARSHRSGPGLSSVWRSKDGIEWEKITEISNVKTVWDIFSIRGRLCLLGTADGEEQVLVYSDNAKDWHRVDSFPAAENLSIVSCREKLYGFSGSSLYTSGDGIQWKNIINSPNVPSRVIALNGRLAALELFKDSAAYSTDGVDWFSQANEQRLSFVPKDLLSRTVHTYHSYNLVTFKDAIWIIGESPDRIYRSRDGRKWAQVKVRDDKRFIPRSKAAITVFQDKLWIMGGVWVGEQPADGSGTDGNDRRPYIVLNDVWSSSDGASWDLATDHAAWGSRMSAVAAEFKGKLVLLGGDRYGGKGSDFELWESADGRAWTCAFSTGRGGKLNAEIRKGFAGGLVHNGKLHVFDRYLGSEFAVSADGRTFSKAAFKRANSLENIAVVRIGGKSCFVSKKDERMYLSWDLAEWRDLSFISADTGKYGEARLFALQDKLYLADVDFQRDVQIRSFPLKIDINDMTVAVDER